MRQVLILVHCQEAYRPIVKEGFPQKLLTAVQDSEFDEVIHPPKCANNSGREVPSI